MTSSTNSIGGDPVLLPSGNLGVGTPTQPGAVTIADGSGQQATLIAGTAMSGDVQLELPSSYSDALTGTPLLLSDAGQLTTLPQPSGDSVQVYDSADDGASWASLGGGLSYDHGARTLSAGSVGGTGTDNRLARWDGTTDIQDSGWTLDDNDDFSFNDGVSQILIDHAGSLLLERSSSAASVFASSSYSDTFSRFVILANGKLLWGDGSGLEDVTLERLAAGVLGLGAGDALEFKGASSGNCTIAAPVTGSTGSLTLPTVAITMPTALPSGSLPLKLSSGGLESAAAINLGTTEVAGNLAVSHLNGGSGASSTTFWRGDGSWATPVPSFPGMLWPQGLAPLTAGGSLTTDTSYCVYLGRAARAVAAATLLAEVTAVGTILPNPSLKVGILSGSFNFNGGATLTPVASASVGATWAAGPGVKSNAFSGLSIAAGDDVWLGVWDKFGGTPWALLLGGADRSQTGVLQTFSGDVFGAGSHSCSVAGQTVSLPWLTLGNLS